MGRGRKVDGRVDCSASGCLACVEDGMNFHLKLNVFHSSSERARQTCPPLLRQMHCSTASAFMDERGKANVRRSVAVVAAAVAAAVHASLVPFRARDNAFCNDRNLYKEKSWVR